MKKIFILSLLVCIWAPLTFAESYSNDAAIERITVGNSWMRVRLATSMANGEGCPNNFWFRLNFFDDPHLAMYNALIAAKSAGQTVHFQLIGCSGGGDKRYPRITHLYMTE